VKFGFSVPGPAVPKARARSGRGGRHYTPARTRHYERTIGMLALGTRPRSWPLDAEYTLQVTVVPVNRRSFDASNVLKSIEDGMNRVAYHDDRQVRVTSCSVEEPDKAAPRVVVSLSVIEGSEGKHVPGAASSARKRKKAAKAAGETR
jgi:crossover junction endodeoxyribonuclease RusA